MWIRYRYPFLKMLTSGHILYAIEGLAKYKQDMLPLCLCKVLLTTFYHMKNCKSNDIQC